MEKIFSKDGTIIAYNKTGDGPSLILVDGATCNSTFGPMPKLIPPAFKRLYSNLL